MTHRAPTPVRLIVALVAAATALAMTGCSPIGDVGSGSRSTPATTRATSTAAAPSSSPISAELAAPDPSLLKAGRATLVHEGLTVTSLLVDHQLPGLAYSLDIVRGQILRQHQWTGGGPLSVSPTLVASSSRAVAVSIRARTAAGTSTAVVYYDPQSNHSFSSTALVAPGHWGALVARVGDLAGDHRDQAVAQLSQPTFPHGTGPALGFSGSGDLVIVFQPVDGQQLSPIAIAGDEAAGLLTPFGAQARAAARYATAATTPATFADLDPALVGTAPPSPAPSTSPSAASTAAVTPTATPTATPDPRPPLVLGTDCSVAKCVVLTFDDGPLPQTADVLAQLHQLRAPATFFMLGTSVDQYPTMVTTVAASGMEIASHHQFHADMRRTHGERLARQVAQSAQNLRAAAGHDPLFLRPPYGARNTQTDAAVGEQGMAVALWSVDTLDWKHSKDTQPAAQAAILATLRKQIGNGGVVLMHDIHGNSRASTTAVVTTLRQQGYTLVTLAELAPAQYRFGKAFCTSLAVRPPCVR